MSKEKDDAKTVNLDSFLLKNPFYSAMADWETGMMNCWNVVDDLKIINKTINNPLIEGIAELYQAKFQEAMRQYEDMLHTAFEVKAEEMRQEGTAKRKAAAKKNIKKALKK